MSKPPVILTTQLNYKHKLGLLLTALSTLLLEFALIRVLSVSLWYHFAFMIISIALLGLGISGVAITISSRIKNSDTNVFITLVSVLYSLSILLSFYIINKIPFDPFSLLIHPLQWAYLPLYYIVITLPFFFSGLIIGKLFITFKKDIRRLYFFDLFGAGLSCFVFIAVLPEFGGTGGVITASLIAALSAIIFSFIKNKFSMIAVISGLSLIIVNGLFYTDPEGYLPIRFSDNKIYGTFMTENPELRLMTKWNSFSRVDVYKDEDPPVDEYPVYTAIIDAGNSTTNIPFVPEVKDSLPPPLDASNLAMILKKDTASVFVIGSGGGGEILSALAHNAKTVTAVEINGILNDLIEKDYSAYWTKGIAKNKKVNIITDDARNYIRRKRIKWDVIISAHTISASATNSGAMSLVENYIMTEEAVIDYLQHLKTDGVLYITRPEPQIPRLITTIRTAHATMGGLNLKNQFFVFKRPADELEQDVSYLSGVLYKKDGFSEYDIQILKTQANILGLLTEYDPVSKQEGIYKDLIESDNLQGTIKKYPQQLHPATDDKPYFEHLTKFTDVNLTTFKESFSQDERAIITLVQKPAAESALIVILVQAAIISGLLLLLPIFIKFRKNEKLIKIKKWKYFIYFALLGLGYIMIEICLVQKFTLFLGQPVYTLLTVISTLLIFSGIGSILSDKLVKLLKGRYIIIFILITLLTAIIGLFNTAIFNLFVRADIIWRVIISVIIIAPLAFLMGIPFPYGFTKVPVPESAKGEKNTMLTAYSWGINCFFSVIGSILVVIFSMSLGFRFVFILSALIYTGAMFTVRRFETK
jgi:hypothetical protein